MAHDVERQLSFNFAELTVHADGEPVFYSKTVYTEEGAETDLAYDGERRLLQAGTYLMQVLAAMRFEWWRLTGNTEAFDRRFKNERDTLDGELPF